MNIKIESNSLFKKLTSNINFSLNEDFKIYELINKDILKLNIIKIDIIEKKDYLVLNKKIKRDFLLNLNDLSLVEWNNNKIWIGFSEEFFIPTIILGKNIFDIYCELLSKKFKDSKFVVSLSIDYGEFKNIVIRFHRLREKDIPIISNNLEEYKNNGILIGYINF